MQLGKSVASEYMSRKFGLAAVALGAVGLKLLITSEPTIAAACCASIPTIIGTYAYFNTKETDAVVSLRREVGSNGVAPISVVDGGGKLGPGE